MKRITAIVTTLCLLLTVFGALNLSASAATAGWTGGWAASAGVTVNGDTVTMVSEAGEGEHTYEKGGIIAKSFDVEWTMRLDHYAGGEFLLIYTGSHRYYFHFGLETISWEYLNAGGSNAMDSISYEFGSDFHNFRLVGSDGTADFYLDGFYITTITPPTSVGSSMMRFYTRGSSGKSGITINDVTVNKFTGRGNEEEGEPTKPSLLEELQTVGWASEALPAEDVFFGFDKAEDYKDWVIRPNWTFEDGLVKHNTTTATATNYNLQLLSMYGTFGMEKGQDLIVTTKFKVNQFDEQLLINVTWPGYACRTFIFPDVVELEMSSDSSLYLASDPINLVESGNKGDGKWHEWMVKTSHGGSKMQLFMDGKPITGLMDAFQNNSWEYNGMIYLAGLANASYGWDVEFDWVDVKLIDHDIRIETPMKNAEYLEGEPIALRASLLDSVEDEIPSVDYKIDGKVVATGYAPEYRATITGLGAGNYDVVAEYEGHDSGAVSFTVREAVKGELETSLDGSGNLSANLKFYEKAPKVTKVEYYLDGACVAVLDSAPYTMTKAGITPMAHTLEAVCYDAAGIVLGEFSESVIPKIGGNTVSKNFSN
ncbi:MAG: hypothetical protein J6A56_00345, partial [Clostridia bacterium]|nr:hypothetical protein [Clostridia bacterium]